jgi:anti-sigma B factor antagonist
MRGTPRGWRGARPLSTDARAVDPSFGIDIVERDGATVVVVAGEIDLATAPLLGEQLDRVTAGCDRPVIIDLDQVTFMDSSGLQVLISHTLAEQNGCEILLTRGSPQVRRLFEISGILEHLRFTS